MYQYIATAQLAVIGGLALALAVARHRKTSSDEMVKRLTNYRKADEALLRSLRDTITALDADFAHATEISVKEIKHWQKVAKKLATEIRQSPDFASHLTGNSEGCMLCTLIVETEKV